MQTYVDLVILTNIFCCHTKIYLRIWTLSLLLVIFVLPVALLPGDIPLQILLLQKYLRSTFDIAGTLAPELSLRILRELSVKDVIKVGSVSDHSHVLSLGGAILLHHLVDTIRN